jgi:flagellar FliL protein
VLIPKIQGGKADSHAEEASSEGSHGGGESSGEKGKSSKGKVTVPLPGKILVNVAGTAGTRYLVANMTLVGKSADLKVKVDEHDPQLRDSAISVLGGKTISDLEKPGMRNIIRSELISAYNDILGKEAVTDIYFTEFAIQ